MPKRPTLKDQSVGFCARWSQNRILSNLAFVAEGILLKEIQIKDIKKKNVFLEEIKKKNKNGGCTLKYPMFWTAEHAYVALRFDGHPEAVRILSSGGPLSSFANMRNNNIETHDLEVE